MNQPSKTITIYIIQNRSETNLYSTVRQDVQFYTAIAMQLYSILIIYIKILT